MINLQCTGFNSESTGKINKYILTALAAKHEACVLSEIQYSFLSSLASTTQKISPKSETLDVYVT